MDYSYVEVGKNIFSPIVSLKVLGKRKVWIDTEAYVDSGATFSIFNKDMCEILQFNLQEGKRVLVTVGDGGLIPVFLHKLLVRFSEIEFNAVIGFSEKLGVGFNLLGRYSFFNKFIFCFNDEAQRLTTTLL